MLERGSPTLLANWDWLSVPRHRIIRAPRFFFALSEALSAATPTNTGTTASSWYYTIIKSNGIYKISFCNSNIVDSVSIAILLEYGHGTKNGGWVEGRNYIAPAIQPIFDKIAESAWKEVTRS